jgi:16S rRNA (guanine1207-N2)-methyltransferase
MARPGKSSRLPGPLPPTQLLLKNADRLAAENLLLIGVPSDAAVAEAFGDRDGALVTFDYSAQRFYESLTAGPETKLQLHFTSNYAPGRLHDLAVIYLQKGRELNDLVAAMASQAVRTDGTVLMVGENKGGIRSASEVLEHRVGPTNALDAARHCVLYEARVDPTLTGAVDLRAWERDFVIDVGERRLTLVSLPGVFSHGRLDEGTRFLLDRLPADITGSVLDLGCGNGVIGAAIKTLHPDCDVSLVDASAFAVESTARTFATNNLAAKSIGAADIFAGVDGMFDLIVSNPPFHQGISTNYDIVSSFLAECGRHLNAGGQVVLVANRFLPYETLMTQQLSRPVVVAQDQKYKVLSSRKT